MPWKTIERRDVLDVPGRFTVAVETVELPNGHIVDDYWQILAGSFVVVFAETVAGEVICLRQYRHGPRRVGLELCAGRIEEGESTLGAARRELKEETGYGSDHWDSLGDYVISSAQGCGRVFFLRARSAEKIEEPSSNDLEESVVVLLSRSQVIHEIRAGAFLTADHVAAIGIAMLAE